MENSIEEAIERLEYIDRTYSYNNYYCVWDLKCIETLLSEYKRLQKENEELKENDNKYTIHLTDEQYNMVIEIVQDDINRKWIQKVIDKMEKLNKEIKNAETIEAVFKIKQQQALQELLEESEENYEE